MPRSKLQITVCSSFLAIVVSLSLCCPFEACAQIDYYHKEFKWSYQGYEWTFNLDIPKSLYETYQKVPVTTKLLHQSSGYGFLTTTNDPYLQEVAAELKNASSQKGYDSYDEVSLALAFIQSLPYTSDSVNSKYDEYPRFPLETLVDNGGDCEDTSILFATVTLIMGYGTVYINPPDHYAVGVLGDNLSGYHYTYNNRTYYYCETTGDGWKIGQVPDEHRNADAYIFPINENQQFDALAHYSSALLTRPPTATSMITTSPIPSQAVTSSPSDWPEGYLLLSMETVCLIAVCVLLLIAVCALLVVLRKRSIE